MEFKQYKDASVDIKFSWRERLILFFKGRIHLGQRQTLLFSTALVRIGLDMAKKLPKEVTDVPPHPQETLKGK